MAQAILRPNFRQEQNKPYFSAYEEKCKARVIEKQELNWQETVQYLQIYWNAADIVGLSGLLTKELRMQYLADSNDVIHIYSQMSNLLWKQVKVLFASSPDFGRVQALLKLKMVDRKMRTWHIDVYVVFAKVGSKFLVSDYELVKMRHIRHKKEIVQHEFLALLVLNQDKCFIKKCAVKADEEHGIIIKDGWVMIAADNAEDFSQGLADTLHDKCTHEVHISCDGDFVLGIEK